MGRRASEGYILDMTIDASLSGLVIFEALNPELPMAVSTMNAVREKLWVKTHVGGIARYTNDYYHRVSADLERVPGNPWFVCTMWLAEYDTMRAKDLTELNKALSILEWVIDSALASGVLAEQINPYTSEPLSVSPLTWSHASFVMALIRYMKKREKLSICDECGNPTVFMHRRT